MRLLLALLCALVSLSLASASVAHGAEASVCVEQVAEHADHAVSEDDADNGKVDGRPDHHVNCHGHQLASLPAHDVGVAHRSSDNTPIATAARVLRPSAGEAQLRPPQA